MSSFRAELIAAWLLTATLLFSIAVQDTPERGLAANAWTGLPRTTLRAGPGIVNHEDTPRGRMPDGAMGLFDHGAD
jgi:hypothetical protein